jgi:FtsP/CotA-like multicopper oxidase with cupredoxin domain
VVGWTIESGNAGTFNPTAAQLPAEASEGENTHYSNGSTVSQTLSAVLAEGAYSLSVDVGDRLAPTAWPAGGYQVQLGVDNGGFQLLAESTAPVPVDGFETSTVNYVATAGNPNLGANLVIRLIGAGTQVNFDNVQLEVTPTDFATGTYTWAADVLRSGTFLYQSGSHVQLQVQMGLYGAMVQDSATCDSGAPCAYPDASYDAQEVLIFSEIDPALHDPMPKPANATVDGYVPQFFLINGEPFDGTAPGAIAAAGQSIVLRLINAGLDNRSLQMLGGYFVELSEDGNRLPTSKEKFSVLLPAAKSVDVMFTPTSAGTYSLFDRRGKLVTGTAHGGGLFHQIVVDPVSP